MFIFIMLQQITALRSPSVRGSRQAACREVTQVSYASITAYEVTARGIILSCTANIGIYAVISTIYAAISIFLRVERYACAIADGSTRRGSGIRRYARAPRQRGTRAMRECEVRRKALLSDRVCWQQYQRRRYQKACDGGSTAARRHASEGMLHRG